MTNIYPYYISTGMFHGFNPRLGMILPSLNPNKVANRIYNAIMNQENEVYIWWFIIYLKLIFDLIPLKLRNFLIQKLTGDGMKTFVGR